MKPSWTDITAFGLLLFFALVMAKGWPEGDWGFGWSAIGAIGTVVTGGIAALIAVVQYQDHQLAKQRKNYYALSLLNDRVWLVERCVIRLAHMIELTLVHVADIELGKESTYKNKIIQYLGDDRVWPKLDWFDVFGDTEFDFIKERSDLLDLKERVVYLRLESDDYSGPLARASTSREITLALENILIKADEVADSIDRFDRGGRERNFAAESIADTRKTMLALKDKSHTFASS